MTTLKILTALVLFLLLVLGYNEISERSKTTYIREEEKEEVVEPHHLVLAEVTAYTSSEDETDDTPTLMADGTHTRAGAIACPSKHAFGTRVEIGNNVYFCSDRMNKRYRDGEYYDIWVETKSEAYEWGRRTLTIKIIHNVSR